jgi:molybdopterin converting factor small subunit
LAEVGVGRSAVVHLPRSLVALFPGTSRTLVARGATVADVIADLDARVPGLRNRLVDAGPTLRTHINVYVDREPATLETPVPDGAEVHVVPAVSGG